jgi:hypothetical protein
MAIPNGTLMAQNDADNLYIGLDLTSETGTANPNDYFWFIVDINDNGVIDSNRDVLFADWPGSPNRLGMWYMAGPDATWPAQNSQSIASQFRIGFGPSINSPTNHRQWQLQLSLSELGISIDPSQPAPVVRFGLRIGTLGGFVGETPTNPLGNFTNLNEIILATLPTAIPTNLGPVVASVGLIGTGLIAADGYCNIPLATPYYINPQEAAFCGTLNLIGNEATLNALWTSGATKYRVLHRFGNTAAQVAAAVWSPILQTWANFEVVGVNDVWQSFGPDANGYYPMVNPGLAYTIQNLIFQWTTSAEPDGIHQFEFVFFNAANATMATATQILTLKLDNSPAIVDMAQILWAGAPVAPCAIVNLTAANPGVQLQYEAYDPEGDLWGYNLTAEYGHGYSAGIYADSYTAHVNPAHVWQGVQTDTRPAPPATWIPPTTCAYLFQVSAWTRTTNGYSYPCIESTDFQTVTLITPGVNMRPIPPSGPSLVAASGFHALPTLATASTAVKAL